MSLSSILHRILTLLIYDSYMNHFRLASKAVLPICMAMLIAAGPVQAQKQKSKPAATPKLEPLKKLTEVAPADRLIDAGGIKTYYLQSGKTGPEVLLLHGFGSSTFTWRKNLDALGRFARVTAMDIKGFGMTEKPKDGQYHEAEYARHVLAVMDALGIKKPVIIGNSMGGAVAQHMALMSPERLKSLVLCASFAILDPLGRRVLLNMREALEWRMNWADHARHSVQNFVSADFFNTKQEQVKKIEALIGGETRLPACYIRQNEACQNHDTTAQFSKIQQPTLIMAGKNDPICSLTATEIMSKGIVGSETILFDNASHFFLMAPHLLTRI
jgi:3-oxoadipate enol-lactonase